MTKGLKRLARIEKVSVAGRGNGWDDERIVIEQIAEAMAERVRFVKQTEGVELWEGHGRTRYDVVLDDEVIGEVEGDREESSAPMGRLRRVLGHPRRWGWSRQTTERDHRLAEKMRGNQKLHERFYEQHRGTQRHSPGLTRETRKRAVQELLEGRVRAEVVFERARVR